MNQFMKVFFSMMLWLTCVNAMYAQNSKCQKIYIWEFTDESNQVTTFTQDLTNAVEEAFVNMDECLVLQRRKIGIHQAQLKNESSVQSIRDMKSNIVQNLSTNGAELVVFGVLNMLSKKEYELQLRIESLQTTKIIRMKSTDLLITDLVDNSLKKKIVNKLVHEMIGVKYGENTEGGTSLDRPKKEEPKPVKNPFLEQQTVDGIKLTVDRFEQSGNKAIFYYTLENIQPATQIKEFHVHINFSELIDQEGNRYKCTKNILGNGQSNLDLIFQNPVKCVVEFNVGAITVTKAAKLKIGAYHTSFQFINLKLN
jgi:hypothetical protein